MTSTPFELSDSAALVAGVNDSIRLDMPSRLRVAVSGPPRAVVVELVGPGPRRTP